MKIKSSSLSLFFHLTLTNDQFVPCLYIGLFVYMYAQPQIDPTDDDHYLWFFFSCCQYVYFKVFFLFRWQYYENNIKSLIFFFNVFFISLSVSLFFPSIWIKMKSNQIESNQIIISYVFRQSDIHNRFVFYLSSFFLSFLAINIHLSK